MPLCLTPYAIFLGALQQGEQWYCPMRSQSAMPLRPIRYAQLTRRTLVV